MASGDCARRGDADQVLLATNGYTDGLWPGLVRTVVPMVSFQPRPFRFPSVGQGHPAEGHAASDTRRLLWYYRVMPMAG